MRRPQRPRPPRLHQPQTQRLPPTKELVQQLKEMVNNSGKVLLFHYVTVWKDEKCTLTEIIFREINSLVCNFFSKNVAFFHEIYVKREWWEYA